MKFQIFGRWNSKVKYECELGAEFESMPISVQRGAAIKKALESGSNLSDSDLRGSNLSGSDLRDSNLSGSNLRGSNLRGSNLRGSELSSSDLSSSDLSGSNLRDSDLRGIKSDFFDVLLRATREISGLELALKKGHVDGSTYEGDCACLVGTIANVRHCEHNRIPNLAPDSSRPAERWFLGIRKGDTPATNQISAITIEWIKEFNGLLAAAM